MQKSQGLDVVKSRIMQVKNVTRNGPEDKRLSTNWNSTIYDLIILLPNVKYFETITSGCLENLFQLTTI